MARCTWFTVSDGRRGLAHFARRRRFLRTPHRQAFERRFELLEPRVVLSAVPSAFPFNQLTVDTAHYAPGRVLVSLTPGVDGERIQHDFGGTVQSSRPLLGQLWELNLDADTSLNAALAAFNASPLVAFAEPDYTVHITDTPDDPQFASLWGLNNTGQTGGTADADIDAPEAWDLTTGSSSTLVAVIDTGVDYRHPDLAANMWVNGGEIPGDRIDNDGNGFVDDVHGYDFINEDGDPLDDQGHGTHVAGTIGAVGDNGVGVAGINWDVKIMALKFLGADGSGSTSDAIRALNYAVQMGADVSNNSYGDNEFSQAFLSAIDAAGQAGHIFVAAAGNSSSNNDASPFYPAAYDLPNLVTVAASDDRDRLASFSNYGVTSVDLAAPGVNILSTTPNNTYTSNSGTSMAAPHVTGVVSLVRGQHPEWSPVQVIDQVLTSVDYVPALESRVATAGRLNAARAVGVPDTGGPRVSATNPSGATSGPIDSLQVTFDESIDLASFTLADVVSFSGPAGAISVDNIDAVPGTRDRTFELTFAPQIAKGTYTVVLGPSIFDPAGNPMNQDGDANNGENPDDRYTGSFDIGDVHVVRSGDVPVNLPMFSTVSSLLTVDQALRVADLDVQVNISYPDVGLLGLTLISPAGVRVPLASSRNFLGADYDDTLFDDEAPLSLDEGAPPYAGSYRPASPLSVLDGTSAQGIWRLEVSSSWFLTGTLNDWSLRIVAHPPGISVSDVVLVEGDAGTTNAEFVVSLSNTSADTIRVDYTTADGAASSPADYSAVSGTLMFEPSEQTKTISVPVIGDTLDEPDESFYLALSNAVNATLSDLQGEATIRNDEARLSIGDLTVAEGDSGTASGPLTVTLSQPSNQTISVNYATADDTASAGSDYEIASGTLTFAPGQTTRSIPITVHGDVRNEADETVIVDLSGESNAMVDRRQAIATIANDDPLPAFGIADASLIEGNSGARGLGFVVRLSVPSGRTVNVDYTTQAGTATSGDDFTSISGTLTLNPGQTVTTLYVPMQGDTAPEPDELFFVRLSNPVGAILQDDEAVGTIENDDTLLSIGDVVVSEQDAGISEATLTVSLAQAVDFEVTVNYTTATNTAAAGSDFLTESGTLVFAPGQTSRPITVVVLNDLRNETDERFFVNLSNPAGAVLDDSQGAATIIDNDPVPSVSIDDATVTEGDTGTKNLGFIVSLSAASGKNVSVDYATADGSAVAGNDYVAAAGTLTFLPGQVTKVINVVVPADTAAEFDKTLRLMFGNPSNATLADDQAEGVILDDDNLSIGDVVLDEGDDGITYAAFDIRLAVPLAYEVQTDYATANGTAQAGSDYLATSGTITFAPGETRASISVPVLGDVRDEADETFYVKLTNSRNIILGDAQATATIITNDAPPTVSVSDASIIEGNAGTRNLTFTISLSERSGRTVSVQYATADITATAGSDFQPKSGTVNILPGQTSQRVLVPVVVDTDVEPNESLRFDLTSVTNATIGDGQAVGMIATDDPLPALWMTDAKIAEGNGGTRFLNFYATLSAVSTSAVSVDFVTVSGTATAGSDFTDTHGTVTLNPGQVNKLIAIPIQGDAVPEADENFLVRVTSATGAVIYDAEGEGIIQNDDLALRINDVSVSEADEGISYATFTVNLSAAAGFPVEVDYLTANNTAAATSDYLATGGHLVFAPGQTSQEVTVVLLNDRRNETNERFLVNLSNPTSALLADAQGAATIVDNDPLPSLSVADASVTEGNNGTSNLSFTVTLSEASGKTVSVQYSTVSETALAGVDFTSAVGTLAFSPGQVSRVVNVVVAADTTPELDKTLQLLLTDPANAVLSDRAAEGVILDDDNLSISDVSVTEGDNGVTYAVFNVELALPLSSEVRFDFDTVNVTAQAGSDYVAASGVVSLLPGQTSASIAIPLIGDVRNENDEQFLVRLSNPLNIVLGDAQASATIENDDSPPTISVSEAVVVEGNAGTKNLMFLVSLSAASGKMVTVQYHTADITATAGSDYVGKAGTLTFSPGFTLLSVMVTVNGDALVEGDERLLLQLSDASNAAIQTGQAEGRILDDDATSTLQDVSRWKLRSTAGLTLVDRLRARSTVFEQIAWNGIDVLWPIGTSFRRLLRT
jgi:subtilisin family serine protease/subtilisin-like proprotein convertase family protein